MKNSAAAPESIETTNPRIMPAEPEWVRAESQLSVEALPTTGVDRKNNVINGYVVALEGPLKSRRGEFDELSLNQMAEAINAKPKGIKCRFTHPGLSDDGLGTFLGRGKNARVEKALITDQDGAKAEKLALRADLHFSSTALDTPPKGGRPLGEYIMDLAEEDPDALSSSVVIPYSGLKEEYRINEDGTAKKDEKDREMPPLWRISKLHASDIVDTGDAVEGLLSVDSLPDAAVRRGCELLDRVFGSQPLDVTKSRGLAFFNRYLNLRYGPEACLAGVTEELIETPDYQKEIEELKTQVQELTAQLSKAIEGNETLNAENMRLEVESVFDDELSGKVKAGERPKLFQTALNLRKKGNEPDSDYRIFIESLKNREGNKIDTEEIAGGAGHSLTIDVMPVDPQEEKREVSGFLMP